MLGYVLRRAAFMLVTLWCVVTVVFFLLRLAPGGPFDTERALPPEIEANLRATYRLDDPLLAQYADYLTGLVQGDFGPSFKQKDFTVGELIWLGLPTSLIIGSLGLTLAVVLGVTGGIALALHDKHPLETVCSAVVTCGLAFPPLVVAPLLVLLFAVTLRWLPAGGIDSPASYVLPAISLAIPYIAAFARLTKTSCLDVLAQPFVTTARAKGMPQAEVVARHVLPGTLMPIVSYLAPAAAALLAGSMIVEEVFVLPGLGRYFVEGAINRDYTLVLGAVIVYAALILTLNFVADMTYMKLDPRTRKALIDLSRNRLKT